MQIITIIGYVVLGVLVWFVMQTLIDGTEDNEKDNRKVGKK